MLSLPDWGGFFCYSQLQMATARGSTVEGKYIPLGTRGNEIRILSFALY